MFLRYQEETHSPVHPHQYQKKILGILISHSTLNIGTRHLSEDKNFLARVQLLHSTFSEGGCQEIMNTIIC